MQIKQPLTFSWLCILLQKMTFKNRAQRKKIILNTHQFWENNLFIPHWFISVLFHRCSGLICSKYWEIQQKIRWTNEPSEMKLRKSVMGSTNRYCNTLCVSQCIRRTCLWYVTDTSPTEAKQHWHFNQHIGCLTTTALVNILLPSWKYND